METENAAQIIAIIPARGNSKRVKRKNLRILAGKPLIAYTIQQALLSNRITKTVVSTEDDEIAEVSRQYGAEVVIRPVELVQDITPTLPVMQHVLRNIEGFDYAILLQPTSPFRTVEDIDKALKILRDTGADSVASVCELDYLSLWMLKIDNEKRIKFCIEEEFISRVASRKPCSYLESPKLYRVNAAIYATKVSVLMQLKDFVIGKDTRAYTMSKERSLDIDDEFDFKIAEAIMKERKHSRNRS